MQHIHNIQLFMSIDREKEVSRNVAAQHNKHTHVSKLDAVEYDAGENSEVKHYQVH